MLDSRGGFPSIQPAVSPMRYPRSGLNLKHRRPDGPVCLRLRGTGKIAAPSIGHDLAHEHDALDGAAIGFRHVSPAVQPLKFRVDPRAGRTTTSDPRTKVVDPYRCLPCVGFLVA